MTKQLAYSLTKGFIPLLVYYIILKVFAVRPDVFFFMTLKEMLGMTFYFSLSFVIADIVIQTFLYLTLIKKGRFDRIGLFIQGVLFNIPLSLLWILGFLQVDELNMLAVVIGYFVSFVSAGYLYLYLFSKKIAL